MSPWKTLFGYIARQFFAWCGIILAAILSIVFLLDYIALIQRSGTRPDATLLVLLKMAALKEPYMAQQIMPFAILFGTMMTFWRMTRSHELVVARSAGISAWQFLAPPLFCAFLVGVLVVTVFNPIASLMQASYKQLENRILSGGGEQLALSRSGLWLRQGGSHGNHAILHASGFFMKSHALRHVMILFLANDTKLVKRIDAKEAVLKDGEWQVIDGQEWEPNKPVRPFKRLDVATNLTPGKIQDSFASPQTMSFWELPGFIRLLEASGFPSQRQRLYFNALLARPFLYAAMVLIAASFSLRMQRRGGAALMIGAGIASAFALYFLSDVVMALGLSTTVPVPLAAWVPTGVTWLLGISLLLHFEDG